MIVCSYKIDCQQRFRNMLSSFATSGLSLSQILHSPCGLPVHFAHQGELIQHQHTAVAHGFTKYICLLSALTSPQGEWLMQPGVLAESSYHGTAHCPRRHGCTHVWDHSCDKTSINTPVSASQSSSEKKRTKMLPVAVNAQQNNIIQSSAMWVMLIKQQPS